MDDDQIRVQMENMGVAAVRGRIMAGSWPSHLVEQAKDWLREKAIAEREREEAHKEQQLFLQRKSIEVAHAARDAVQEANKRAEAAYALAREANALARDAVASAALSAVAARDNKTIATLALIAAVAAFAVAAIGILVKG